MAAVDQSSITSAQLFGAGVIGGGPSPTGDKGVLFMLRDTTGINLFAGCAPFGGNINGGILGIFANGGCFNPKGQSMLQKLVSSIREDFSKMNGEGNSSLAQSIAAAQSMLGAGVQIGGDIMGAASSLPRMVRGIELE